MIRKWIENSIIIRIKSTNNRFLGKESDSKMMIKINKFGKLLCTDNIMKELDYYICSNSK